jgi:hypothetical protein
MSVYITELSWKQTRKDIVKLESNERPCHKHRTKEIKWKSNLFPQLSLASIQNWNRHVSSSPTTTALWYVPCPPEVTTQQLHFMEHMALF